MTGRVWMFAMLAFGACEKAADEPAPAPPPVHARVQKKITYAAKTQPRYSGENNNYFGIVEDGPLFVVADAVQPAASQLAADTIDKFPPTACAPRRDPDEELLWCALDHANAALRAAHQTSSVTVALVRERETLVAFAGAIPVVLRHGAHGDVIRPRSAVPLLGSTPTPQLELRWVPFAPGDTLVLLDAGLLAAIGLDQVRDAVAATATDKAQLATAVDGMVDRGMAVREHAELTAVVVHLAP